MAEKHLFLGRYDYASFAAFTMYAVCSLAIPLMIVSMGKSLNFPLDSGGMSAGGGLHLARSIFMIASLLLCGAVSGRLGKRFTIGGSLAMIGGGMLCCAFVRNYAMLVPCLIFVGLGEGVCEGLLTPFIQDLHPKSPERHVNLGHSFWSVGICLVVVGGGGLLTLGAGWRIVLGGIGCLTALSSILFLWRENPSNKYPECDSGMKSSDICHFTKEIFREPLFWRCGAAMFFGAGAEFGLTFWATAYIQLTFHTGVWLAGLGTGMIALGMFVGRAGFGYIARPQNLRRILLFSAIGTILVTSIMVFLRPGTLPDSILFPVLFVLLFFSGIGIAPYWPTTQVYGVINLPHLNPMMLYVYYSTLGIPGCGFFSWFMGAVGDRFGLTAAILVVPACLLVFCAIVYIECWILAPRRDLKISKKPL